MAKASELKPGMAVSFTSKWTDATTGEIVSVGSTMSKVRARGRDFNFKTIAVPNKDIKIPKAKAPVTATGEENLRAELVRLAHANPELRAHLVPLLRMSAAPNCVPGLNNWDMFAGGTGGGGKNGYETRCNGATYTIQPFTNNDGRFSGYFLSVWPGKNGRGHTGIESDGSECHVNSRDSIFWDPKDAVKAAQAHATSNVD